VPADPAWDAEGCAPRGCSLSALGAPHQSGAALLPNLLKLARTLRVAGLTVSAAELADLAQALDAIDLARRADLYAAARSILAHKREEQRLVDQALDLLFLLQGAGMAEAEKLARIGRHSQARLPDADSPEKKARVVESLDAPPDPSCPEPDTEVRCTYSATEILREKDFACYTEEELRAAQHFIDAFAWQLGRRPTRRKENAPKATALLDVRRTVRLSLAQDGEMGRLAWRRRRTKPRPLVVICDISGSMERYSRLFLHFVYALSSGAQRAEAFVFGTRLTRITPAMRFGDVDRALDSVSGLVQDWSGGTRIGESLRSFNYAWSRRVLARGAITILITDAWDRGDLELLAVEAARLRRSTHRLIWLNPLLGASEYQPLALGSRTLLPHVDDFLPLHNLASLESLALHLGRFLIVPQGVSA
jgi:hypothetical protein